MSSSNITHTSNAINNTKNSCAVIILAAGNSSRLGEPKQLVTYQQTPLLVQQIDKALTLSNHVICVLGAHSKQMTELIADKKVTNIINTQWQLGMASSIAAGVNAIPNAINEVMILLVDQWKISVEECQLLLDQKASHDTDMIVTASSHNEGGGRLGPPVIFNRCYFESLSTLTGQLGAKPLLEKYSHKLIKVALASAFYDLDTQEQLLLMREYERTHQK